MSSKEELRLFITGRTNRSQEAVHNLRSIITSRTSGEFDLSVIDVLENPEQAEAERILATPTLVRTTEHGAIRIIGDLSNTKEVLKLLGVRELQDENGEGGNDE
ncbi:MAG: circadian clock KaiB family protein [Spirochaetia bacterium]